jgi:hypothetical protein
VVDEEVEHPSSAGSGKPPGWYPSRGGINEQSYWDGEAWTAQRRWNGATWTEMPPPDGAAPGTGPGPPRGAQPPSTSQTARSKPGRRWLAIAAVCVVVAGVLAVVLVLTSTGSARRSRSAPSTTVSAAPSPTTPTTSVPFSQTPPAAEVAACQADAQSVDVAVQAYQAQEGAYPSPASPWSAATYAADYTPLTSSAGGGPYLHTAPGTTHYVIEYDSSGHVWIAPPGSYQPTYNAGQSFDGNPDICLAAVG